MKQALIASLLVLTACRVPPGEGTVTLRNGATIRCPDGITKNVHGGEWTIECHDGSTVQVFLLVHVRGWSEQE